MNALRVPSLVDIEAEEGRRSFRDFIPGAFAAVEPARPFKGNWHIDAIALHIEAVYRGELPELVINMPPGYGKSLVCTVMSPVWRWINHPGDRFMCISYSGDLALEHSRLRLILINSPWFKERWGHKFRMVKTGVELCTNDKGGSMIATSINGMATGLGGEHIIIDDPLNPRMAASEKELAQADRFIRHTMGSRLRDKLSGTKLCVMQRLHERDPAGIFIELGWESLHLPAEFDKGRAKQTAIGWNDPRTKDGELLWPAHEGPEQIAKQKELMGSNEYARQYQQVAVRDGGNYIKLEWYGEYDEPAPRYDLIVASIDSAMKTGKENDYSVMSTFGFTENYFDWLDCVEGKWETPDLETQIVATFDRWKHTHILAEDTAAMIGLMQSMARRFRMPFIPIKVHADKIARTNSVTGMIQAGRVRLPKRAAWKARAIEQTCGFPAVPHDDIHDSLTQLLNWARDNQTGRVEYTRVISNRADKYGGL